MRGAAALLLVAGTALAGRPPEAVEADRAAAEADWRDLERRTQSLSDQQTLRRDRLRHRLRALYKLANGGYLRLLAGADDVYQLNARREAMGRLVARDLDELVAVRAETHELDAERARSAEQLSRVNALADEVVLAEVAEPTGLQARQGQLTRPVPGPTVANFGVYRDATLGVQLARRGIELRSRAHAPVRAVAAGMVRWLGDVPGLGHGVAIDHGDGYTTLTAHLGQVRCRVGDQLPEGAMVGEAESSTVYLELAQARTPIDPAPWLAPPSLK
jgi:septal ring factor EnvC (AmiA/AmiB activator)